MVCVYQACLLEFFEEVSSFSRENFETPSLVRLNLGDFKYNGGKFGDFGVLRCRKCSETGNVLLGYEGVLQVPEDFVPLLDSIPFVPRHSGALAANVNAVPVSREFLVRPNSLTDSAKMTHSFSEFGLSHYSAHNLHSPEIGPQSTL